MAVKNFTIPENQEAWDAYYDNAMKDFTEENPEELAKKKTSIAQYKCSVTAFEKFICKSFDNITAEDIEAFANQTGKKSKFAHVNAFLLSCLTNGYIKNSDTEFLISLLPEAYRKLGRMIAENG